MWEQLSAEQKQNYGEDYFERALRSLEKYTEKVRNDEKLFTFLFFKDKLEINVYSNASTLNRMPIWDQLFDALPTL